MTTAYTSLLGLALPVTGELSGTWGDTVNNSITSLLDSAIAGTTTLSADTTLTTTTGASNQARQAILLCTGHVANITITAPAQSKIYTVINASATYTVKIRGAGPTTGITIPVSSTATVAWNGSDFVDATNYINGNITLGSGTPNGVAYLNGSKVLTTGSALVFDGTNLGVGTSSPGQKLVLNASNAGMQITDGTNSAFVANISSANGFGNGSTIGQLYLRGAIGIGFSGNGGTSTQMALDSSGNLGLGVTPSWDSSTSASAIQFRSNAGSISGSSGYMNIGQNWYQASSANRYLVSSLPATLYEQNNGTHKWYNAPSGTAGSAITFTQAMTLNASGQLLVGTTSTGSTAAIVGKIGTNASLYTAGEFTNQVNSDFLIRLSNTQVDLGTSTSNPITFTNNGTERVRIDSSGNLLVNTTSAGARVYAVASGSQQAIRGDQSTAGAAAIYGTSSVNSGTGYVAYFTNSGSGTGLYISNTAAWQSTSDERLKTDIQDLDVTARLLQLRPRDYLWKSQETSDEPNKRSFGFIAQEVKEIFPELVGVSPDGMFSVEYTGLIAPLVKAIQEQQAIIQSLTARITALEGA